MPYKRNPYTGIPDFYDAPTSTSNDIDAIWSDYETIGTSVYRVKHSFQNFIRNSGFWAWTGSSPDIWWTSGDAVTSQISSFSEGTYSCRVSYNYVTPASGNTLGNSWNANQWVWYTVSFYYKRNSGTGGCAATIRLNTPPYTAIASLNLDGTIDGQGKLALLSGMCPEGYNGEVFLALSSTDTNTSEWDFDEVMVQEGKDLATTWLPSPTDWLGETSSTAYRGDRGKTAYDHSQTAHLAFVGTSKICVGTSFSGSPSIGDLWVDTN
jgi:hypothetical protein